MPSTSSYTRQTSSSFFLTPKKSKGDSSRTSSFVVSNFRKIIGTSLTHLNKEEKDQVLRTLFTEYYKNKARYDAIFANTEIVAAIHNLVENQLQNNKMDEHSTEQGISNIRLPIQWGITGVILLLINPVEAQASSIPRFTAHTGQAPGGTDLCSGTLLGMGCKKGYTTQYGASYKPDSDSIYSRNMRLVGSSKDASAPAYAQLSDCFSAEVLGNLVVKVLNGENTTDSLAPCSTSSMPWGGYSVDTVAYIPSGQCVKFQRDVDAAVINCKSTVGSLLKAGQIALIAVVSVVGLVLIALLAYGLYKLCKGLGDAVARDPHQDDIEAHPLKPVDHQAINAELNCI